MNTPEDFDMDAFLNDFRRQPQSDLLACLAMIHHLWKNHPLNISTGVTLVALSVDVVFDVRDVQHIRKYNGEDYCITFKSGDDTSFCVYRDTPEYKALQRFITSLTTEH